MVGRLLWNAKSSQIEFMTEESRIAAKLLAGVASCNERLIAFAREIREEHRVASVHQELSLRDYRSRDPGRQSG